MKKFYVSVIILLTGVYVSAQKIDRIITVKKVSKIEKTLSADDMEGRAIFTPGIDKAAAYIAKAFKKAGLHPPPSSTNFFQ
jgi:hypothetical protein